MEASTIVVLPTYAPKQGQQTKQAGLQQSLAVWYWKMIEKMLKL